MNVQDNSTCLLGLTFLGMGLVGFCLSLRRLLGPAHPAKPAAPAFLWLSGGWFCIGLSLYLAGETWHLPHNQRPFMMVFIGGGIGLVLMVMGLLKMAGYGGKRQADKEPVLVAEDQPMEGVWPPAPKREEPSAGSGGLPGESRSATEEKPNANSI